MTPSKDLSLIFRALAFAANKHRDQRRKDVDATPYINHPIALAATLAEAGISDPVALCGALLHDTVEDTETTQEELQAEFGAEIAAVVMEVTDDKSTPKAARKQAQVDHAPQLSPAAKLVKLADKISNVTDVVTNPPSDWPPDRKQEYCDWASSVVNGLRGTNQKLEADFDRLVSSGSYQFNSQDFTA